MTSSEKLNILLASGQKAVGLDVAMLAKLTDIAGDFAVNLAVPYEDADGVSAAAEGAAGLRGRANPRSAGFDTARDDDQNEG